MTFVAPKGIELGGAVQFKIKADVKIPESVNVRAGYSANAIMSIGKKENEFSKCYYFDVCRLFSYVFVLKIKLLSYPEHNY